MGDNLEVALFDQRFEAGIVGRLDGAGRASASPSSAGTARAATCSSTASTVDAPRVGDLLAVPATGAYCYTMANNYNGNRRIPVVFAPTGAARGSSCAARPGTTCSRATSDDEVPHSRGEIGAMAPSAGAGPAAQARRGDDGGDRRGHASRASWRASIGLFQLSLFGIGATIGTGIFIVLTQAVPGGRPGGHLVVRVRRHRSPA